ncbi:hypothetical protein OCGS_1401 [Oceaniovalibus guishaninsula JLT2003]|uniref:Uncharacterized protein n=1 Tax=Oceaniovalibus guishaninsula JLT2003 TaxID=1231392 RepID=K2HAL2_9RHOB|nr:hypothetical protein [Oceaniovalibus guishaninsula]EKE44563.1 hypothetical protein OCGS_1401 [Oceaniovalibus guishaninsula JLT2003]
MANNPKDFRDPKVSTTTDSGNSTGKWIGIAVGVIVVLLLLAWLFGLFDNDVDEAAVPVTDDTVVITD